MFKGVKVDSKDGAVRRGGTPKKMSSSFKAYGRHASMASILEESVSIFDDAKKLIPIGPLFRFVMWVYSNRVLVLLAASHFVATMVIWGKCQKFHYCYNGPILSKSNNATMVPTADLLSAHFAIIKWQEQEDKVPLGAPRYWAKRIIVSSQIHMTNSLFTLLD